MSAISATTSERCGDLVLAADPFVANRYHFGMLLGVDDLDTDQAYHRGKAWLHQAWLHGAGTVWGLEVLVRAGDREVVVAPGLAIDHRGRELLVTAPLCVDVGRWLDDQPEGDVELVESDDSVVLTAHVELCADPCRSRPVPSIADPCDVDGDAGETAFSRTRERGHARLVAGPAPPTVDHYPRLRAFMTAEEPPPATGEETEEPPPEQLRDEAQVAALEARVAGLPGHEQCAAMIRGLAAIDAMRRAPAEDAAPFPVTAADSCVLLAELVVQLRRVDERWVVVGADEGGATAVDNTVRPVHVDTATVLGLLTCPPAPPTPS